LDYGFFIQLTEGTFMKPATMLKTLLAAVLIVALGVTFSAAGEVPKKFKMAAMFASGIENAWARALVDSFENLKAQKYDGLEMSLDYTENVWGEKTLATMEAYAESGEYDVILMHSSATDEVEQLMKNYPDTMFVVTGSGNKALGDNMYLLYMHVHEPSYLIGMIAGAMTKTNTLGLVGLFPADDVNDQVHAFRAGAKSMNDKVKLKVSFIESWYDPAKASEAANAQIAAGADLIFQLGESFEVCKQKNIPCFGNYVDLSKVAPKVVPTSTIAKWEPHLKYLISQWKEHKKTGKPYNAPKEKVWFSMAQGGSDLAPYHVFDKSIPAEVKEKVAQAKADIISGKLKVKLDMSLPKSD
jgi:basic membrane protein A